MPWTLSADPVLPISVDPPEKRTPRHLRPKEEKITRADCQRIHDDYLSAGQRPPPGIGDSQPATVEETWFRHHYWRDKRLKVYKALHSVGQNQKQLDNFDNCGAECVVEFHKEENRYRLRGSYCHSRHCEPCMKAKSNLLAANLRERLADAKTHQYRFLTLTLRHSEAPLCDQIKKLYTSFKKLRTSKLWKSSQRGGAAMLEVKWDPKSRKWHPHLHIVAEGNYIGKDNLSEAWHRATGDSFIVDIRRLDKTKDVAFYVAKYVTKGTNAEVWDDSEAAAEWVTATRGVRSCATYGSWRGYKLLAKPTASTGWNPVGLLRNVVQAAYRAEHWALHLLNALEDCFQYNPGKPRKQKPPAG